VLNKKCQNVVNFIISYNLKKKKSVKTTPFSCSAIVHANFMISFFAAALLDE